jgi:hypothetical protein
VQPAAGIELETYGRSLGVHGTLYGRHEGRGAEASHVEAQEEVMHGGVAHHDHIVDITKPCPEALDSLARELGHLLDDVPLELVETGRLMRRVVEAGDDIVAPCHLWIHGRFSRQDLARLKRGQVGGDGGSAYIDCQSQNRSGLRGGPYIYDLRRRTGSSPDQDFDVPIGASQHTRQRLKDSEVERDAAQPVLRFEGSKQPLGVAGVVF